MNDIEIAVSDPPDIPGLCFRHFRGESDYPGMLEVLLSSEQADQIERTDTLETFASNYSRLANCDPHKDMIFVEVEGQLVAYSRGWWSDDAVGGRSYNIVGFVVPHWRRSGIGRVMLSWMEDHLRDHATANPTELDRFFQMDVSQHQEGKRLMLEKTSYQPVRYFYEMVRPNLENLPIASLPEGLELRTAMPEHYQAIWQSIDETSVDEWGYSPPTHEDYHAWLESPHFQPALWQIAWDKETDRVVGHVLTYIDHSENKAYNRKRGYTEGIGVDPLWRKRGVARALITHSLQAQRAAGMTESALNVDSENEGGATQLYESCGFQVTGRNAIYRKPLFPGA